MKTSRVPGIREWGAPRSAAGFGVRRRSGAKSPLFARCGQASKVRFLFVRNTKAVTPLRSVTALQDASATFQVAVLRCAPCERVQLKKSCSEAGNTGNHVGSPRFQWISGTHARAFAVRLTKGTQ